MDRCHRAALQHHHRVRGQHPERRLTVNALIYEMATHNMLFSRLQGAPSRPERGVSLLTARVAQTVADA